MNSTNPNSHTLDWPADCNNGSTMTSTMKFCYDDFHNGNDCYIFMEIDNLPSSLQCAVNSFPYCVRSKIYCTLGTDGRYSITVVPDDQSLAAKMSFEILHDDSHIKICCGTTCCEGVWH